MTERKKILLIGAGAIGCVYANALSKSDNEFAIAADSDRIRRYRKDGIFFCDNKINAKFITPDLNYGKADIILVTVKNYALKNALEIISPAVGNDTIIIPLLNGITSEDVSASFFSPQNILYGYYIGHTSTRNGNHISQDGNYQTIVGDYPSSSGPFSRKLIDTVNCLTSCGIHIEARSDMKTEIWKKFAVNICLNQTTAYYECTYGDILSDKNKMEFFCGLESEIKNLALAENIKGASTIDDYINKVLQAMDPKDKSSMAQDVESKRKTEVDDFAGEVIRLSARYNLDCSFNQKVLKSFSEIK